MFIEAVYINETLAHVIFRDRKIATSFCVDFDNLFLNNKLKRRNH